MKTAEIQETIKEQLKEEAKFFQNYDVPTQHQNQPIATKEKNLDPFKKVNWKNIYDSNKNGEYHTKKDKDGNLLWAYFIKKSKGNRGIKDFADDIVGTIQTGDLQVTRFAYQNEHLDDMIKHILSHREPIENKFIEVEPHDIWFTEINMELPSDKLVMEKLGAKWLSSKITAVGSEVRGLYYLGNKSQPGVSKYEDITIKKMNFESLTKDECSELVEEIKNYQDAINPWSYDGINGNYGGPEKTWYTIEIVPIRPDSETDWKILDALPKLKKIVDTITEVGKCTWLVITRVEPKNGLIMRHTDRGNDSWGYKTKNGPKVGQSLRIHYPIQVDDDCVFTQLKLDGEEVHHRLKTGNYYYMDKRKPHWVENKSENYRFHVIMDIECEQKHLEALL